MRDPTAETISSFLQSVSAPTPIPAAGAVIALSAAAAASLVAMVCGIAARGSGTERFREAEATAHRLRARLEEAIAADMAAFEGVLTARRRADCLREAAIEEALKTATLVPLGVGEASEALLRLCSDVVNDIRPSTAGDLGAAALLAAAAVQAVVIIVNGNRSSIRDAAFVAEVARRTTALSRADELARRVLDRVGAAVKPPLGSGPGGA